MHMKSLFLKSEGDSPKNRIWDFLITFQEYDCSMKDIAKQSKIAYSTLKLLWPYFEKNKIVAHTRLVGRAKMYRINLKNPLVKAFTDYYYVVVKKETDKLLGGKEKISNAAGHHVSVGVYARGI